jgi:hypothetical protein
MCKSKCTYGVIDGVKVHINGDLSKMDNETLFAIRKMINLAKTISHERSKAKDN